MVYCTPNQHAVEAQEFQEGSIRLTNKEHAEYSVVSVVSEPGKQGFLLDVASAMSGLGMVIHEAIIQASLAMPAHVCTSDSFAGLYNLSPEALLDAKISM